MALFSRKKKTTVGGGDDGLPPVQPSQPTYAPRAADLTVGDYANGMPNIRLGEMLKSFGRQLIWVVPLFLIGSLIAWKATEDFKRTYTGDARIMVQIGDEYVYQPVTGQAGQAGMTITADTIALNEVGIIKNDEIISKVHGIMMSGEFASRFDPKGVEKLRKAKDADKSAIKSEMYRKMHRSYSVSPRPKSSIIDLSYKHEDGAVAVATLKELIAAYKVRRQEVFIEGSADIIAQRRKDTESQLNKNERAIARFLEQNNISDFTSEQGGVRKRTEELRSALNLLRAQMSEAETALATVENQLRQTPQEINLYVDDRASARISQAELELKQLLAKYLPTSDPVRQKRTELAELKSLQSSYGGKAAGARRVGPNTVYQALLTRRNTLQATADSYREKEFTLQRQLDSADNKVRRLTALSPSYASLLRERETLSSRLRNYNAKEQEALVNQEQQAEATNQNVKVISEPKFPSKGRNTRLLAAAGAMFAWGLTLFMLALLRVFLDPRLYVAPGPRHSAMMVPQADYIPEPVAPYVPEQTPYAPAAQPAVAQHGPSVYTPETEQTFSEYVPVPADAAQAYAQHSYAQPAYEPSYAEGTQMQYSQNPVYQDQQAPQMQYDPNAYAHTSHNPAPYTEGSAAVDMYSNPYLTGQNAGALHQPAQAAQTPYDSNGPQLYDPNAPQG